jgi:hypothetical protein
MTTKDRNEVTEAHKLAIDSGWMTIDEVRAIEDLPTVGGDFSAVS